MALDSLTLLLDLLSFFELGWLSITLSLIVMAASFLMIVWFTPRSGKATWKSTLSKIIFFVSLAYIIIGIIYSISNLGFYPLWGG